MNHLSSLKAGDTVYAKGFEDQEFLFLGKSAEQPDVVIKLNSGRSVKTRAFPSLVCRLKNTPEAIPNDQAWIIPAIQVAKKPFSRLVGFSVFIAALFSGAAIAQSKTPAPSFVAFCEVASEANTAGISAAPGSELARRVIERSGVKKEDYLSVWQMVKSSIFPVCRGLW